MRGAGAGAGAGAVRGGGDAPSLMPPSPMASKRCRRAPMSLAMIASSCWSSRSSSFLNFEKSRHASEVARVWRNLLTSGKSPCGMLCPFITLKKT